MQLRLTVFLSLLTMSTQVFAQFNVPLLKGVEQLKPDNSKVTEVRLDPSSALTNDPISSVAEAITFLPLQTTPTSMFQKISQLEVTNKYYIIWDEQTNCILFFDKKGTFVKKISSTNPSVNPAYKRIDHFTINEAKNELVFNDSYSYMMYYYTLEGDFIKAIKKSILVSASSYASIGSYDVYYQNFGHDNTNATKLAASNLIIVKNNEKAKIYFPFDTTSVSNYSEVLSIDRNLYNNRNGITYVTQNYDYNVYGIDSSANVSTLYHFVLPAANTVPDDFLTNKKYNKARQEYTSKDERVIYALGDFYKRENNLLVKFVKHGGDIMALYNLKTQSLVSLSEMLPDKLSHGLPFTQGFITVDTDNKFIASVNASTLFRAKVDLQANKEWQASLTPALAEFFKANVQQNPVLTLITFKQEY